MTTTNTLFNATADQKAFTSTLAQALEDNYVCDNYDDAELLAEQIIEDGIICDESCIEQLCESFAGCDSGWHPERDFTEEYCCETGLVDPNHPLYNFIDFQEVWDRLFYYDMQAVTTKEATYFFHNF